MKYDKQKILDAVKEEFELSHNYKDPRQWAVYIFFMIKSGMTLYDDTIIDQNILMELSKEDKIKCEGIHFHQGEKAIRYRFKKYRYPAKYYRAIPNELRQAVLDRDNKTCVKCNAYSRLSIDHIVPWSFGGLTELNNLQVLCRKCNSEKSNN